MLHNKQHWILATMYQFAVLFLMYFLTSVGIVDVVATFWQVYDCILHDIVVKIKEMKEN